MGFFDAIFGKWPKPRGQYKGGYRLLNGYEPVFQKFNGDVYQSELIRAAINARATHISKLDIAINGSAKKTLQTKLRKQPNEFQTWSQFLYRLSTILDVNNTAVICPVYDSLGEITGIYCPLPNRCEIVQYGNIPYMRYEFSWGERAAIELDQCGIMTKFQYSNDMFGENNNALEATLNLINMQNQGIEEGVKNSASYRFMARVSNFSKTTDLTKERERFTASNFSADAEETGGILLFPNTYQDIKQIDSKPWVADADTMKQIADRVYSYFGVNEDILSNKFNADVWAAFYEGAIEPFAVQFSEVMTKMLFTMREQGSGAYLMATANRLQYMSNADKLSVSAQMADRGLMTRNEIRQIWNLPPLEEPYGSQLPARGEYYNLQDDQNMKGDSNANDATDTGQTE